MKPKDFVVTIENPKGQIPIIPRAKWPQFPEPVKPSQNSPYRTVLWFHPKIGKGVRVIVEGRDEKVVAAYAAEIIGHGEVT